MSDWKSKLNMVYSTNPDYQYAEEPSVQTAAPENARQQLRITLDRKMRNGKQVTLVADFVGSEAELKELGKLLKSKCGVGGSVKDNQILIQGDFREKVLQILLENGYKKSRII